MHSSHHPGASNRRLEDRFAAGGYPDSFPGSTLVNAVYSSWKNNGMECSSTSWSMLFTNSLVSQKRHLGSEEPSGTAASSRGRLPWANLGLLRPSLDSEVPGGLELQVTMGMFCFVFCLFAYLGKHIKK